MQYEIVSDKKYIFNQLFIYLLTGLLFALSSSRRASSSSMLASESLASIQHLEMSMLGWVDAIVLNRNRGVEIGEYLHAFPIQFISGSSDNNNSNNNKQDRDLKQVALHSEELHRLHNDLLAMISQIDILQVSNPAYMYCQHYIYIINWSL